MDQIKIGNFIAQCRKNKNLTQLQLAQQLNVTDRAVSKWETGKAMPDSMIMLDLCKILGITINDLLSGEIVSKSSYDKQLESNTINLVRQKQYADKILYTHLHDNRGSMPPAGGTDLHLLPFDGLLDWQAYARALACAGYRGTLNLELSCFHSKAYCAMSFSDFAALAFERVLRLRELKQEAESAPAY